MKEVTARNTFERNILRQVKVSPDGKTYLTIRGLAGLAGVDQSNLTKKINNLGEVEEASISLQINDLGEVFLSDDFAFDIIMDSALKGNKKALVSLSVFGKVGLRHTIHQVTGWELPPKPNYGLKSLPTPRKLKKHEYSTGQEKHDATPEQTWVSVLAFCRGDQTKAHQLNLKLVEAGEIDCKTRVKKVTDFFPTEFETFEFKRKTEGHSMAYDSDWLAEFAQEVGF